MGLKKLSLALLAVFAVGAVAANSAMATATESSGFWYKGSTKLAAGTKEPITCSLVTETSLTATVGATPIKFKSTGVACPESKIFNESSKAKVTGRLKFTGVTVVEPVGCTVVGGEIESEPIKGQIYMEGTKALDRISPAAGTIFAEVEVSGCSIANVYALKGVVFGEASNATNVLASAQKVKFTSAINTAAGGELTLNGHPAAIGGESSITLTNGGEFKSNET